jgi:DNA-binding response OmpR family regulator
MDNGAKRQGLVGNINLFLSRADAMFQGDTTMSSGKTILIVEDQDEVLDIIKLRLERDGYEVFVASSGDEAFSILRSRPIDALIADVNLGDTSLTGLDLATEARRLNGAMRILLISGEGMTDTTIADAGADQLLLKPFDIADLSALIGETR